MSQDNVTIAMRFTVDGKELTAAVSLAKDELDKLTDAAKRSADAADKHSESNKGLIESLGLTKKAVLELAEAFGAFKVLEYVKEAAQLAASYESLGIAMKIVGNNAGYTGAQMNEFAEKLSNLGMTGEAARNALMKMAQAQMDLTKATELGRMAMDASIVSGKSVEESLQIMIRSVNTGMSMARSGMGITVDYTKALKEYATAHGMVAGQLLKSEQSEARLQALLKQGPTIAGAYAAGVNTYTVQMRLAGVYAEETKLAIGGLFTEAMTLAAMAYTGHLKETNEEMRNLAANKELVNWANDITEAFVSVADFLILTTRTMIALWASAKVVWADIKNAAANMTPEKPTGVLGIVTATLGHAVGMDGNDGSAAQKARNEANEAANNKWKTLAESSLTPMADALASRRAAKAANDYRDPLTGTTAAEDDEQAKIKASKLRNDAEVRARDSKMSTDAAYAEAKASVASRYALLEEGVKKEQNEEDYYHKLGITNDEEYYAEKDSLAIDALQLKKEKLQEDLALVNSASNPQSGAAKAAETAKISGSIAVAQGAIDDAYDKQAEDKIIRQRTAIDALVKSYEDATKAAGAELETMKLSNEEIGKGPEELAILKAARDAETSSRLQSSAAAIRASAAEMSGKPGMEWAVKQYSAIADAMDLESAALNANIEMKLKGDNLTKDQEIKVAQQALEEIGLTTEGLRLLKLRRDQETLSKLESQKATIMGRPHTDEEIAQIDLLISKTKQLQDVTQQTTTAKQWNDWWKGITDSVEQGLTTSLMNGFAAGKGFGQSFIDSLKTLFKTTVLKVLVQGVMGTITGTGMSLAAMAAGSGGVAGAGSEVGGLFNMASAANSVSGWFGGPSVGSMASSGVAGVASTIIPGTVPMVAAGATEIGAGAIAAGAGDAAVAGGAGMAVGDMAMAAVPYVGLALAAAYALGLFGSSPRTASVIGTGLAGTIRQTGSTASIATAMGTAPDDRWGGSVLSPANDAQMAIVNNSVTALFDNMTKAATKAGFAVSGLDQIAVDFTFSTKNGDQVVADLVAGLALTSDQIALKVIPNLKNFQLNGETLTQTFQRLTTDVSAVKVVFDLLGKQMPTTTDQIIGVTEALAALFGSSANMQSAVQTYYTAMYSKEEQAAKQASDVASAFALMGKEVPKSKEAFIALVNSVDLTTDAGRALFGSLMVVAPEFAAVSDAAVAAGTSLGTLADQMTASNKAAVAAIDAELTVAGKASSAANTTGAAYQKLADTLSNAIKGISQGALSPDSISTQYDTAKALFSSTSTLANSGDQTAIAALPQMSTDLLNLSRQMFASGEQYNTDWLMVNDELKAANVVALAAVDWNQRQATTLDLHTTILTAMKEELLKPNPDTAILQDYTTQDEAVQQVMKGAVVGTAASIDLLKLQGIKAQFDLTSLVSYISDVSGLPDDLRALMKAGTKDYAMVLKAALDDASLSDNAKNLLITGSGAYTATIMAILSGDGSAIDKATAFSKLAGLTSVFTGKVVVTGADSADTLQAMNDLKSFTKDFTFVISADLSPYDQLKEDFAWATAHSTVTQYIDVVTRYTTEGLQEVIDAATRVAAVSAAAVAAAITIGSAPKATDIVTANTVPTRFSWADYASAQAMYEGSPDNLAAFQTFQDFWDYFTQISHSPLPNHAMGGIASGWSIVGEQGPELANFSNPARIYTADQTSSMLHGGGGMTAEQARVLLQSIAETNKLLEKVSQSSSQDVREQTAVLARVQVESVGKLTQTQKDIAARKEAQAKAVFR
jgi:hypothetical protein